MQPWVSRVQRYSAGALCVWNASTYFINLSSSYFSESFGCVWNRNEQLSQWDSPMRVKLSVWKPYVRTLLIELLPWALLINQSKWDLWLFEGEKIVLQVPAGKIIIPPNFQVI